MPGFPDFPPSLIQEDGGVKLYIEEIGTSIQHRTPLCVSLVEKTPPSTQESHIPLVVERIEEGGRLEDEAVMAREDEVRLIGEDDGRVAGEDFEGVEFDSDFYADDEVFSTQQPPVTMPPVTMEPIRSTPSVPSGPYERFGSYELSNLGSNENNEAMSLSGLEVGSLFENKKELQITLHKYAMDNHFQFKVQKSRKDLLFVKCLEDNCNWRLRALKLKHSEMFEIRKYVEEHTCSILTRRLEKRPIPSWVIAECIKKKYMDHHHDHMPKKIMEDFEQKYGQKMTYNKAWRCREKALMAVRGTVEDSYGKLPSYLYMLEKKNDGTLTDIQTDEHGHFRYMFMSLGLSIRGFRSSCRPVLCVDASFLKHKVGGQLLVAIALDANEQLYPVAFGVVDSENNNSWTYFMQKLRVAIGEVQNLVFVSDRHPSIANALSVVFPEAHHGACTYHIKMNIMAKFKTDSCHAQFDKASRAYTVPKFNQLFEHIRTHDPRIAAYLEEIGVERWSRAHFPVSRYSQMTSNYAESFNSQSRNARKFPITTLADYIRFTIQDWFQNRREKASEHHQRLTPYYERYMRDQADKARLYRVHPLNRFQFYVHDGETDFTVNLKEKSCTCRVFDISGLPCLHALAACRDRNVDAYDLCSRYYTSDAWVNQYAETCYPVCDEDAWDVPEYIKERVCLKPPVKVKKGRPQTKRRSSQGEIVKAPRRCSSCGGKGHNRATCSAVMPAPSTSRASGPQPMSQPSTQHSVQSLG